MADLRIASRAWVRDRAGGSISAIRMGQFYSGTNISLYGVRKRRSVFYPYLFSTFPDRIVQRPDNAKDRVQIKNLE